MTDMPEVIWANDCTGLPSGSWTTSPDFVFQEWELCAKYHHDDIVKAKDAQIEAQEKRIAELEQQLEG